MMTKKEKLQAKKDLLKLGSKWIYKDGSKYFPGTIVEVRENQISFKYDAPFDYHTIGLTYNEAFMSLYDLNKSSPFK